jgi:hypothetical protein
LLDGASYHKSDETQKAMKRLGLRAVISAPYSYQTAPIELFFAFFKRTDINPDKQSTGKK